jgi:hypothetical protein
VKLIIAIFFYNRELGGLLNETEINKSEVKMTNSLDIIHCLSLIKSTPFRDWSVSPSSSKKGTPTLLGPINRASPYLQTTEVVRLYSIKKIRTTRGR